MIQNESDNFCILIYKMLKVESSSFQPYEVEIITCPLIANTVAEEIKLSYAGPVGFDTESSVMNHGRSRQICLIQIYVPWRHRKPVCYLFHVAQWNLQNPRDKEEFPISLRQLLTSKEIVKAVAAPENDVRQILFDFGICMAGYFDIQTLATSLGIKKVGLNSLAELYIKNWNGKEYISHEEWHETLSNDQIRYAANDAYASGEILRCIMPTLFNIPEPHVAIVNQTVQKVLLKLENQTHTRQDLYRLCNGCIPQEVTIPGCRREICRRSVECLI